MFTEQEGESAVRVARKVVEAHVLGCDMENGELPPVFNSKMGVFVTIKKYPSYQLRGCIGYPEPVLPLKEALFRSAVSAANDPRFRPLSEDELERVVMEVTLLTPPQKIECGPEELPGKITCGADGLIVSLGHRSGLLLPQVPVEQGWGVEEFLDHTCMKAGLAPGTWKKEGCTVKKFQGEIFIERKPGGDIVRKDL